MKREYRYKVGDKVLCHIMGGGIKTCVVDYIDEEAGLHDVLVYKVLMESGFDLWMAESFDYDQNWFIIRLAE